MEHCIVVISYEIVQIACAWVVGQFGVSEIDYLTEPSAGRGPQRGSPNQTNPLPAPVRAG